MYMFVTRHKNVPFYRPCFQNYQVGGGGGGGDTTSRLPHTPNPKTAPARCVRVTHIYA